MRVRPIALAISISFALACTDDLDEEPLFIIDDTQMPDPELPPQHYSARLTGVLAGPGKVDNTPWDGTGTLAETLVNLAANLTNRPILRPKKSSNSPANLKPRWRNPTSPLRSR